MDNPNPNPNPEGTEMQQMQNPPSLNPTSITSTTHVGLYAAQHLHHNSNSQYSSSSSSAYYPQSQNPNPDPNYIANSFNAVVVQPPGLDPALPAVVNTLSSHVSSGYEALQHQLGLAYTYSQTVGSGSAPAPAAYYQDPNAAIMPHGLNPYAAGVTIPSTGAQKLVTSNPGSNLWTNPTTGSQRSSAWKKGPKKIKVVQSAWCEICRVDCNSKNVLDQHKLGKKHKKNLEKLIVANTSVLAPATVSTSVPPAASTVSDNPVIGPQENPDKAKSAISQKPRKKVADAEDLETKKKKILEGGAAVDAVRTCALCNVVCNSETVFRYHLAGQKHAAMVKKHAFVTGVAAVT